MIQSKPSEKGEIIPSLSRMGDVLKDIPQRGKVIVALCAVHSVIDSDEADTFLWENHFRVHSHLQVVSP